MNIHLNQKGQTLVIVIMVMIIALATGLIVSERIISGYKRTTTSDSSARALSVAEALVERLLIVSSSTLDSYIANNNCGSACQLTITGSDGIVASASATLAYSGNSTSRLDVLVSKNNTYEINMTGYSASSPIELCWDNAISGSNPSVYVSYVYGASPYSLAKYAYNSASTIYSSNGFSSAAADLTYPNCFTIPAQTLPNFIRVRSVYNNLNLHVIPQNGATIPIQGYLITATGFVNNVKKTVSAVKTTTVLPSSFDFAIFSTSNSDPLQN